MNTIDWGLLRAQKQELISLIEDSPDHILWGLVGLIDNLQDEAVDSGEATEEEVFNLKKQTMKKYSIPITWESYQGFDVESEEVTGVILPFLQDGTYRIFMGSHQVLRIDDWKIMFTFEIDYADVDYEFKSE